MRDLPLLLSLAWSSLRHNLPRAAATALAVMVAGLVVLSAASVFPAARDRQVRGATWVLSSWGLGDGLLASTGDDWFAGEEIASMAVAVRGDGTAAVLPRGLAQIPGVGELVVSPRMAELLATQPALRDRYPGQIVGEIDEGSLPGPRSLRVVRGVPSDTFGADAAVVTGWDANPEPMPVQVRVGAPAAGIALLLPMLALIGVSARLGGHRSALRAQALRLTGMTIAQLRLLAGVEFGLTGLVGGSLALATYSLAVPWVAERAPIAAGGYFPADLAPHPWITAVVLVGLPLLVAGSAWAALGRASAGVRRLRLPRLRALSLPLTLVPLVAGFLLLDEGNSNASGRALLIAYTGLVIALIVGAPLWAERTAVAARNLGLPGLLTSGRVQAHPRRAARVSQGLALLVLSAGLVWSLIPMLSDGAASQYERAEQLAGANTLVAEDAFATEYTDPRLAASMTVARIDADVLSVVDCKRWADVLPAAPDLCSAGVLHAPGFDVDAIPANSEQVGEEFVDFDTSWYSRPAGAREWAGLSDLPDQLGSAVIDRRLVPDTALTNGRRLLVATPTGDLEQARTAIWAHSPEFTQGVRTFGEVAREAARSTAQYRAITWFVLLLSILIAAASFAITFADHLRESTAADTSLWLDGVNRRSIATAHLLQVLAILLPALAVATLAGIGVSRLFVAMATEQPIDPVPVVVVTCLCALLLPVLLAATQVRSIRPDVTRLREQ